jgi:carbonic anhydrase/acetyltransferase-like protein (isoleucine patch superfamily)
MRLVSLVAAWPLAAATGFGRWEDAFTFFAHACAQAPGLPGDYLRVAYYRLTLEQCPLHSRISFGSFFAQPQVRVAAGVYIGAYCVIGASCIGERTQIASAVQILSGRRQHQRLEDGQLDPARKQFESIMIGADCWIGAAAIVMEDVGDGSTIGAGAIVTHPVPPRSVAVGNPARVIRTLGPGGQSEQLTGDSRWLGE